MFHSFAISDMGLSYCWSGGQTSSRPSRFQPVARPMRDKRDPAIADLAAQQTFRSRIIVCSKWVCSVKRYWSADSMISTLWAGFPRSRRASSPSCRRLRANMAAPRRVIGLAIGAKTVPAGGNCAIAHGAGQPGGAGAHTAGLPFGAVLDGGRRADRCDPSHRATLPSPGGPAWGDGGAR